MLTMRLTCVPMIRITGIGLTFPLRNGDICLVTLKTSWPWASLENRRVLLENRRNEWRMGCAIKVHIMGIIQFTKTWYYSKSAYMLSVDTFDNASARLEARVSSLESRHRKASCAVALSPNTLSLLEASGKADGKGSSGSISVKLKTAPNDWIGIRLISPFMVSENR